MNDAGQGAAKTTVYVTALAAVQTAPADLASVSAAAAPGRITVTWSASEGATSYKVARQASGGAWVILENAFEGTTYEDTAVVAGTQYRYTVRPMNDAGQGAAKTTAYVTALTQ